MPSLHVPVVDASREVAVAPSGAPRARRRPLQIPSLDGLRAVSFLLVFVAHAGLKDVVPGGFGVTVFFFLSGFLITTLMRLELEETGRVSLSQFYLRRALRILPPFYIVLAGATLLAGVGFVDGALRGKAVASQALHMSNYWIAEHGWSGIAEGTGVYWSLAVEEHFYLLFPAAFLLLGRLRLSGRGKAFAFWSLCAAVLAWRCVLVLGMHAGAERLGLCSDTRIDSIAFGCALAVWKNPALEKDNPGRESPLWASVFLPGGILLLLATFLVRNPVFRETLRYTLQGLALIPVFVMAVRHPDWRLFRVLNARPVRFVGALSYVLYLVHHVALDAFQVRARLGVVPGAVIALVASMLFAWAMHVLVEVPCARMRARLGARERHTDAHLAPTAAS